MNEGFSIGEFLALGLEFKHLLSKIVTVGMFPGSEFLNHVDVKKLFTIPGKFTKRC